MTKRAVILILGLFLAAAATEPVGAAKKHKKQKAEDLTNFLLSPGYAQWMVGPIAWIASDKEKAAFARLGSDQEAAVFVEEFWAKRKGQSDSPWPTDLPQAVFGRRVEEANRLYSEGTRLGSRTDRGTIFVLYGPPEKVVFEEASDRRRPPIEVWVYPSGSAPGLNDEEPKGQYFFTKQGDYTVFAGGAARKFRGPVPGRRPD